MKRVSLCASLFCIMLALSSGTASAALTMTIDRNQLDFRAMDPGQTMELSDQGVFHNQFSLTSDNGRTWYLKARLVRVFTSGIYTIPDENFRWTVVSIGNGRGTVYNSINTENPFTRQQSTIYTSADTDDTGTQVDLQFRYTLTIPKSQIAGSYDAVIRFTMIESI